MGGIVPVKSNGVPRIESVKMVGEMQDSKDRKRESIATSPSPWTPIAVVMKIMMAVMKTIKTMRGFTNIVSPAAAEM